MILHAIVTAYIATGHPCSDGRMPVVGRTVAVPRSVPLGSVVVINGHRYLAQDHTARRFDGRFDIFTDTKQHAVSWGKHKLIVTIFMPRHRK